MEKFKQHWFALTAKYSNDEFVVRQLYDDLVRHYKEPHRFYHTVSHIEKLLSLAVFFSPKLAARDVVEFAIFYHDVIYNPGRGDNEFQSAAIAKEALVRLGFPRQTCEEVLIFIEATSAHQLLAATNTEDLKYFLDFDLNILAAEKEEYAAYAAAVRKEFYSVPDAQYSLGRSGFLKSLLKKPNIFFTIQFQTEKEGQARKNIQKEIDDLTPHI